MNRERAEERASLFRIPVTPTPVSHGMIGFLVASCSEVPDPAVALQRLASRENFS